MICTKAEWKKPELPTHGYSTDLTELLEKTIHNFVSFIRGHSTSALEQSP